MTRIAIDAMGGDFAPRAIVEGAVWAAVEYNIPIELVGKQYDIERELDRIDQEGLICQIGGGLFPPKKLKVNTKSLDIKIKSFQIVHYSSFYIDSIILLFISNTRFINQNYAIAIITLLSTIPIASLVTT